MVFNNSAMAYRLPKSVPEMFKVKSSNVKAVGYDPFDMMLYIQFLPEKKGDEPPLYRYYRVPESVYTGLMKAASKGMYVWAHIRDRFSYAKWMSRGWKKGMALQRSASSRKYWKKKQTARLRKEAGKPVRR